MLRTGKNNSSSLQDAIVIESSIFLLNAGSISRLPLAQTSEPFETSLIFDDSRAEYTSFNQDEPDRLVYVKSTREADKRVFYCHYGEDYYIGRNEKQTQLVSFVPTDNTTTLTKRYSKFGNTAVTGKPEIPISVVCQLFQGKDGFVYARTKGGIWKTKNMDEFIQVYKDNPVWESLQIVDVSEKGEVYLRRNNNIAETGRILADDLTYFQDLYRVNASLGKDLVPVFEDGTKFQFEKFSTVNNGEYLAIGLLNGIVIKKR